MYRTFGTSIMTLLVWYLFSHFQTVWYLQDKKTNKLSFYSILSNMFKSKYSQF